MSKRKKLVTSGIEGRWAEKPAKGEISRIGREIRISTQSLGLVPSRARVSPSLQRCGPGRRRWQARAPRRRPQRRRRRKRGRRPPAPAPPVPVPRSVPCIVHLVKMLF
uniref:Uncharacterized protein n=1 Tax=Aegilops tauschii subsp. strangulata TaxID=200361 RepID=A0A453NWJ6_AEGTS